MGTVKEKCLDLNVIETNDVVITIYDGKYSNHEFGLRSYVGGTTGFCIEFLIKQKADPKKRLNRKLLDSVMKDEAVRDAMYDKIFGYIECHREVKEHVNYSYCWSNVYTVISGNRLIVSIAYKNANELHRIESLFKNNERWCFIGDY